MVPVVDAGRHEAGGGVQGEAGRSSRRGRSGRSRGCGRRVGWRGRPACRCACRRCRSGRSAGPCRCRASGRWSAERESTSKARRDSGTGETTITSERVAPRTQTPCGWCSSAKKVPVGTIQTASFQVCAEKPERWSPTSRVSSSGRRWKAGEAVCSGAETRAGAVQRPAATKGSARLRRVSRRPGRKRKAG